MDDCGYFSLKVSSNGVEVMFLVYIQVVSYTYANKDKPTKLQVASSDRGVY